MSQAEVKEAIIAKVRSSNDDDLLETVLRFLDDDSSEEEFAVTDEQWQSILEADRQIDAGNFLTQEQATQQWKDLLSK